MPYVALATSDKDPESPLTSFLVNALDNNVAQTMSKAAGAPVLANGYVTQAMLAAAVDAKLLDIARIQSAHFANSVVNQAAMKTATFSVSATAFTGNGSLAEAFLNHPGGANGSAYDLSLGPTVTARDEDFNSNAGIEPRHTGFRLWAKGFSGTNVSRAASISATWSGRYITASKPYSLDGINEIEWFVFVKIKDGEIVAISISPDPPWAHNGPSNITPDGYFVAADNQPSLIDKPYKLLSNLQVAGVDAFAMLADPATRAEAIQLIATRTFEKTLIDYDFKNTDMALFPHPFINDGDLAESEIVMADYLSPVMLQLGQAVTAEQIQQLLSANILGFTDTVSRPAPPGVTLKTIDFL